MSAEALRVAISGNPNSGKTCLFNALTGSSQVVGNYPGVTVEKREGLTEFEGTRIRLTDLPGTYSLTAYSEDERVARNFVIDEKPQVVINVLDASNLERNLYLTTQILEMGVPVVLALNMIDVAKSRGYRIDTAALSALLGVPVIETIGNRGKGTDDLLKAVIEVAAEQRACVPRRVDYGTCLDRLVDKLADAIADRETMAKHYASRWLALKLLEKDKEVMRALQEQGETEVLGLARKTGDAVIAESGEDAATLIAEQRYGFAAGLVREVVSLEGPAQQTFTDQVDSIVCNRVLGFFFVGLCLYAVFKASFFLADGVTWVPFWNGEFSWETPTSIFEVFFSEWLPALLEGLEEGPLRSLCVDGVIGGVGAVMGFAPLIFFLFVFLAILEDSGYIARIAFVSDKVLHVFGLQGKSILAMIVSGGIAGGCAVPGVMATRTLRDKRDRLTTMMVAPFMNCGAKMPVHMMLIAAFFSAYKGEMLLLLVFLSWAVALGAAWCLRRTVIKGEQTPFVMELPPYHVPHWKNVLRSASGRTWMYAKKAGTLIMAGAAIMWALMYFPRHDIIRFDNQTQAAAVSLAEEAEGTLYSTLLTAESLEQTEEALEKADEESGKEASALPAGANPEAQLIWAVQALKKGDKAEGANPQLLATAKAFIRYREEKMENERQAGGAQLTNSFAGRMGKVLEPLSGLAGFNWKTNIALIGGFAAKEVVVSTLGTAYSMGEVEPPASETEAESNELARRLRADWNPLRGFVLMLFVMVYSPCIVTFAVIKREAESWKWALFSTLYTTVLAYVLAVLVYQVGLLLGIGLGA